MVNQVIIERQLEFCVLRGFDDNGESFQVTLTPSQTVMFYGFLKETFNLEPEPYDNA